MLLMSFEQIEMERKVLQSAFVLLVNGDPVIANYMARDLECTKAAGLDGLAWSMDKAGNCTVEEARIVVEGAATQLMGNERGALIVEGVGIASRLADVHDMLRHREPTDGIRERLTEEAKRLVSRLREIVDEEVIDG